MKIKIRNSSFQWRNSLAWKDRRNSSITSMETSFTSLLITSLPRKRSLKIQLKYTILVLFLPIPKKGRRRQILMKSKQASSLAMTPLQAILKARMSKKWWGRLAAALLGRSRQAQLAVGRSRRKKRSKDLWQTIDPLLLTTKKQRRRSQWIWLGLAEKRWWSQDHLVLQGQQANVVFLLPIPNKTRYQDLNEVIITSLFS